MTANKIRIRPVDYVGSVVLRVGLLTINMAQSLEANKQHAIVEEKYLKAFKIKQQQKIL